MRSLHSNLLLVLAALLLTASLAAAQDTDRNGFYLESIRNSLERLESISPQNLDGSGIQMPDLNKYEMQYEGPISLRRNFARTVSELATAPLGMALNENTVTEAGLKLGSRTGLSFSSTGTKVSNLWGLTLNTSQVDIFGLTQSFGKGDAAGSFGFTRNTTRTMPYLGLQTTTRTDAVSFQSGLTKSYDLSLKASQTEKDLQGGYDETDLQGVFTVKFSGGDGPFSFARNDKLINGVETTTEKIDLTMPVMWRGAKALAEHHSAFTLSGGAMTKTRTTHFLLPQGIMSKDSLLDFSIVGQDKGTGLAETRTTRLVSPLHIDGKVYGAENTHTMLQQAGTATETLLTKLSAPLAGGQAVIQRQTVNTETTGGETEQRQLSVVLPPVKVGEHLSVQAQRVTNETVGSSSQEVTNLNVSAQPVKPLQVEAQYQLDDKGDLQAVKSRQLHTKWTVAKSLLVQGHVTESEALGGTANSVRLVELIRDGGQSGLGLRAGLVSCDSPTQQVEAARRLEVRGGRPDALAFSAAYSEYDVNSNASYVDDAVLALSLKHGDPKDFAVEWKYEDQPTRTAPLKALGMAMPAFGGSLKLGYQANPVGPDGKTVRQAYQYDATLGRRVFGDLNLEVGYRYLDYNVDDLVDQNLSIKLDGGKEERAGKLQFSYFTGDFCTQKFNDVLPGSILDLRYTRAVSDSGKLTLWAKRQTAPWNSVSDSSSEGGLELSLGF